VAGEATPLSPQIRILAGGEARLLTDTGRVDPDSLDSYRQHGGYAGLTRADRAALAGGRHRRDRRWRACAGSDWSAARMPAGLIGAIVAGLVGAWLMVDVLHVVIAPELSLAGIPIISAILGAAIVVLIVSFAMGGGRFVQSGRSPLLDPSSDRPGSAEESGLFICR